MASQGNPSRGVEDSVDNRIRVLLQLLREESGSELVYLSRFVDGQQQLRIVVGDDPKLRLYEGAKSPLESSYCWRVPQSIIPHTIRDSAVDSRVSNLPGHTDGGIAGYVAHPVFLPNGQVYGTICSITSAPIAATTDVGPERARLIASLVSASLPRFEAERAGIDRSLSDIQAFIQGDGLKTVFQPAVDMLTGAVVGYEALTRFGGQPPHAPDWWLAVAEGLGLGLELELAMVRSAVREIVAGGFERPVSINASPQLISAAGFMSELDPVGCHRNVIEITERAVVADFQSLQPFLEEVRSRGWMVAVDDAGAGFANFRHILDLGPDVIKLDMSLVRDIDHDPSRQALAQALVAYAKRMEISLVTEGVETAAERETLISLGYRYGQGFLFARPASAEAVKQLDQVGRRLPPLSAVAPAAGLAS